MMEKAAKPYILFRFFQDFALVYPVYLMYFRQTGLDHMQVALLLAIWAGSMLVLEIPSGIIADLWSRRGSVLIALLLKGSGFLIWLLKPDFAGFAAGFILWGFQEALCSGTVDALLFDALLLEKRQERFTALSGMGTLAARAGIVFSVLLGAALFSRSASLVLLLSAASMLLAALFAVTIPESRNIYRNPAGTEKPHPLRAIAVSLRSALQVRGLFALVLFWSAAGSIYGVLDEYDFLFARHNGIALALVGVWGAFRIGLEGLGGFLAHRFEKVFSLEKPRNLALWTLCSGILLLAGTAGGHRFLLPFYFLFFLMMASMEIIYHGILQKRIESSGRATVSSLASFLYTASGMVIVLLFGAAASRFGLRAIFISGAVMQIISAVLYFAYVTWFRKERQ